MHVYDNETKTLSIEITCPKLQTGRGTHTVPKIQKAFAEKNLNPYEKTFVSS